MICQPLESLVTLKKKYDYLLSTSGSAYTLGKMPANQSTSLRNDCDSLEFLSNPRTRSVLEAAADTFIKHTDGTTEIWAASRDWFLEEWGRDTFISLPGLLLTTQRYDEARQSFGALSAESEVESSRTLSVMRQSMYHLMPRSGLYTR